MKTCQISIHSRVGVVTERPDSLVPHMHEHTHTHARACAHAQEPEELVGRVERVLLHS